MPDVGPVIGPLAFAYASAAAGAGVALALRAGWRFRGRRLDLFEATWCALLPLASAFLLPLLAAGADHGPAASEGLHLWWHRVGSKVHASPAGHALLHLANWVCLVAAAGCLLRAGALLLAMRRFARSLRGGRACRGGPVPFVLLPSSVPLCFTVGLWNPVIHVTEGLRERVTDRDLAAALAHEAAHARRRDGAVSLFLLLAYTLLPVPGTRLLLEEWRLAVERECDAEAARRLSSPCDVAAALVRVAALVSGAAARVPAAVCFARGGGEVEERVQALLALPGRGGSTRARRLAALLGGGLGLLPLSSAGFWLHHLGAVFAHH